MIERMHARKCFAYRRLIVNMAVCMQNSRYATSVFVFSVFQILSINSHCASTIFVFYFEDARVHAARVKDTTFSMNFSREDVALLHSPISFLCD